MVIKLPPNSFEAVYCDEAVVDPGTIVIFHGQTGSGVGHFLSDLGDNLGARVQNSFQGHKCDRLGIKNN